MGVDIEQLQANILTGVFGGKNAELFDKVRSSDLKSWSKASYNFLWNKAQSLYLKTGDVITWPIFRRILAKTTQVPENIKTLYVEEIKPLFSTEKYTQLKEDNLLSYSVMELNAIQRNADFFALVKEHAVALNTGKIDDLDEGLDKTISILISKLNAKRVPDYEIVDLADNFTDRMKERYNEKHNKDSCKKFYWRYPSLRRVIPKGNRGGDVIMMAGATGVGKSITAVDVGGQCGEQGLKAVYITSENTLHQTCGRFDANITGWEYDTIQAYGFANDREVKLFENAYKDKMDSARNLKIIKMAPNNFSVLTIHRALNELKNQGFCPNALIIDSPDLMRPSVDLKISGESFGRVSKSMVYWEIKAMAIDLDIIVFVTSQLTREVGKRKDPLNSSIEDVSDSYDKARIVDVGIMIIETVELALENKLAFKIGKNRDGLKPVEPIILRADKSRMRFYDDIGNELYVGDSQSGDSASDELTNRTVAEIKKKNIKTAAKKSVSLFPSLGEAVA